MTKNKYQKSIASIIGTKLISFNPDLARALGSIQASLLLNQLLFWWDKGRNPGWIYKTIDEMQNEIVLSRREQDRAIKICKKFELIEVVLKGIPAKRNFKLNIEKIENFVQSYYYNKEGEEGKEPVNYIAKEKLVEKYAWHKTLEDLGNFAGKEL